MKNTLLICGIIIFLVGCTTNDVPARENMLKNKSFVYLYYPTLKECLEAQPDPEFFINCHQQVDFYPNKRADIMLTDIYYRGTYRIQGNLVVLTFEPGGEIPDGEITFQMLNPTKLLHLEHGNVWKKISGRSIWE